jgi:L-lysine 2,3-aminomutase
VQASHHSNSKDDFAKAIQALSGVTLLNQSVLLKGVNDSVSTLSKLSMGLFELGILPQMARWLILSWERLISKL